MCKEKVAEPKLRKRQPTSDGEEATSEFSKCITALCIGVLFFYPVLGGGGGGVYDQVSAGAARRSTAVRLKLSTNTLGCSITHKAGIIFWSLVCSRTVSLNA